MNRQSLKAHLEQLSNDNSKHLYTFICECEGCTQKNWVKVITAQIPNFVSRLGYGDEITKEDLQKITHLVVQKLG